MIILFVSLIALGLGVVLMKEYGWADLTGNTRNDLVFETRHKKYGAYEIRQKYSNRLVIAFVGVLGFISLAAVSPKLFNSGIAPIVKSNDKDSSVVIFENTHKEKEKEKILENKLKQDSPPAGAPTKAIVPPVASDKTQLIDSTKKNDLAINDIKTKKGDTSAIALNPTTNPPGNPPGTGKCLNCPPKDTVYTGPEVDEQASFNYKKYIQDNMHVPTNLSDLGVTSGKIHVSFIVGEDGSISAATIKKGLYPELDREARRVIASMPKWKPAKKEGKNVPVRMIIPVNIVVE